MTDDKPYEVRQVRNGLDQIMWVVCLGSKVNNGTGLTDQGGRWYPSGYVANDDYLHQWITTKSLKEAYLWKTEEAAEQGGRIWHRQQLEAQWTVVPLDETVHEQIPESGTWAQQGDNPG